VDSRQFKTQGVLKELSDEERLADSASPIQSQKLRLVPFQDFAKNGLFFRSSHKSLHNRTLPKAAKR
jgi:hypothetical protein